MKVLFAGPTLFGLAVPGRTLPGSGILCRAPARQGDIARAALDGASAIGLVDGRYEDVAAPWHKEILFALSRGIGVYGAASMGALRAAECSRFGMVPVGAVAARYASGELTDDAAVAQVHAPPELGCIPLSEALVTVEATVEAARAAGALSGDEARALGAGAGRVFFKDRTWIAVAAAAGFAGEGAARLARVLETHRRDVKREDALALIEALEAHGRAPRPPVADWTFREPTAWKRFIAGLDEGASPGRGRARTSPAAT